jgi:hypothetical protein
VDIQGEHLRAEQRLSSAKEALETRQNAENAEKARFEEESRITDAKLEEHRTGDNPTSPFYTEAFIPKKLEGKPSAELQEEVDKAKDSSDIARWRSQEHLEQHLPEYIETARQEAEADGKSINIGSEKVTPTQETASDIGEIGLEAAVDNTPNVSNNVEEHTGPETLDPLSHNDKEIAEDMAYAQEEIQDMIANVQKSSLTQEQKDDVVKRLTEQGGALAEKAKNERLKVRETYELASGDLMGRILDFQLNNLKEQLVLDTGRESFSLVEYGMDKGLVDLTYTVLGIDPPTEQELLDATIDPKTGPIMFSKQNDKYRVSYAGQIADMPSSNVKGPIRFATITIERL